MAYTIKGLAKANECETHDMYGLADLWNYWLACNCNDRQSINDLKSLRKADRQMMLGFLRTEALYTDLFNYIVSHI